MGGAKGRVVVIMGIGGVDRGPLAHFMSIQLPKLPPEVNRILYVRNLPFKITSADIYDLFGKYGATRHIYDAKAACEALSGFNLLGRYLIVVYYQPTRVHKRT